MSELYLTHFDILQPILIGACFGFMFCVIIGLGAFLTRRRR
jgi:hypothetical protein